MAESSTNLTPAPSRFTTCTVGRGFRRRKSLSRNECKKRGLSRRSRTKQPTKSVERRAREASGLSWADRRKLFPIIKRVFNTLVGRCWLAIAITRDQRADVADNVRRLAKESGLRVADKTLEGSINFWIKVHNSSRDLWFTARDLDRSTEIITGRLSRYHLAAINEAHRKALGTRQVDYAMLAIVHCGIVKNTLIDNKRTKKSECGVKSIRRLLSLSGYSVNRSIVSMCFRILADLRLIRCLDATFEITSRCRRWVPTNASWTLPFVAELADADLSSEQQAERDLYRVAPVEDPGRPGGSQRIKALAYLPCTPTHHEDILTSPFQPFYDPVEDHPEAICVNESRYGMIDRGSTAPVGQNHWAPAPEQANDWDGFALPEHW